MTTLTFTGKQHLLRAKMDELEQLTYELFPVGATLSWCMENSTVEHGTVIRHEKMAGYPVLRVTTEIEGFYSIVALADILRAQS